MDQDIQLIPRKLETPVYSAFVSLFRNSPLVTIKHLFHTYKDAITAEDMVTYLFGNGFASTRQEAVDLGQKMIDAHLIFNAVNVKEAFKDKEKIICSMTLKGKLLVYGQKFLLKSIENLSDQAQIDTSTASKFDFQFEVIQIHRIHRDNTKRIDTYGHMIQRMVLLPDIFLDEFSSHLSIQKTTGLNLEMKDRSVRSKIFTYTFTGAEFNEWILDNTTAENLAQANAVSSILSRKSLFRVVQGAEDSKEIIYQLPAQELTELFSVIPVDDMPVRESQRRMTDESERPSIWSKPQLLQGILDSESMCEVFRAFLETLYCVENLDFYKAVVEYESLFEEDAASKNDTAKFAKRIWSTFLAGHELNVLDGDRKTVKEALEKNLISRNLFETMKHHILGMMLNDSLPKFMTSERYKEIQGRLVFMSIMNDDDNGTTSSS